MEKSYISHYLPTCFYVDFEKRLYGVQVNIKDIDKAKELIKKGLEKNKQCIEALKNEWKNGLN